jgi:hypothetical protein
MKGSAAVAISLVSYAAAAASPLVWPSRWDEVEDYMNMLSGYGKVGFSDGKYPILEQDACWNDTNSLFVQPLSPAASVTTSKDDRTRPNGSEQLSTTP